VSARTLRLGELAEFIRNGLSISNRNGVGGVPITRIETISEHVVDPQRVGYAAVQLGERDDWLLQRGDILFSHINSVSHLGKVALYESKPEHLLHGMNLLNIRPRTSVVLPRYLVRALRADGFRAQLANHIKPAVNQASVSISALKTLTLRIPDLVEQRRIADILDKADAIRRKRKEAIALTEELLRSAFLEMFGDPVTNPKGWPVKALGELLDTIDSGWSPVCEARRARGDEWGVLKLGAVTFGRYDDQENKALRADLSPVPELEVKAGDVLFSRKNTYEHVAACVFVASTRPRLMLPDLIFRFVLSKRSGIRPETLWALLSNERMRKQVQGLAGGTAGSMPNISKERLKRMNLPVPPIALQERFAGAMRGSESTRTALEAAARESEVLFNSLVARAFAGEL
jgi:type I restriction enzyme S subunit